MPDLSRSHISLSRISFTLALSTLSSLFLSTSPGNATEIGKTTQFFRAQALQNIAAGHEAEALESYKTAIKVARTQYGQESTYLSELYFEMGNLARSNGQSEIAQNCYKSAVKYRPNDIPARLQLADLERNTKNIKEAFDDSKKAFQINQSSPIARKGLMLCLQQCGRPAEAAQIAATLRRAGKSANKVQTNLPTNLPADTESRASDPTPAPNENAPIVTNAVSVQTNSALHWAPDLKKKIDDAAAKKARDAHAAAEAKKKQADELKAENEKRAAQHKKDEADRKSKAKAKKEEPKKKEDAKKAAKSKPVFVEPEVNAASLKTSAKTIPQKKADENSGDKGDKAEKVEKPASKGHLGVGAVTEKVEKPVEEKHDSSVSENEPARVNKPAPVERPQSVQAQMPQSVPITISPQDKKSQLHRPKGGVLVPPPPATPFIIPSFQPPPGIMQAPPSVPAPKPRPPKPSKPAPAKESSADESAPAKVQTDDPEFLLDWGGGAGKKKHSK